MQKDDAVRLRHMLEAAREALSFAQGRTRQDLDTDRMLTFSLVKAIEILGEAAARTSDDLRNQYPSIPWPQITAMRNRLIHAYFDINLDRIWDTVTDDLPPLVADLEQIISKL